MSEWLETLGILTFVTVVLGIFVYGLIDTGVFDLMSEIEMLIGVGGFTLVLAIYFASKIRSHTNSGRPK